MAGVRNLTQAEAAERARLLDVTSYDISLDLASAGQGAEDFITDKAIDALSYGANKIGINTEAFDKVIADNRQLRA